MEKQPHFFTIEEANAMLPQLEAILKRFDQKKYFSEKMHDELLMEELLRSQNANNGRSLEDLEKLLREEIIRVDETIQDIESEIRAIRSLGCKVRNLSKGWIDFPAQRDGSAVFYVWKRGEPSVRYYRPAQENQLFPIGSDA